MALAYKWRFLLLNEWTRFHCDIELQVPDRHLSFQCIDHIHSVVSVLFNLTMLHACQRSVLWYSLATMDLSTVSSV